MDDHLTQYLKCDIELDIAGPSHSVVNGWAADILRKLADRLERDEYEDGHHEVTDKVGKPVGTIYLDFSEGDEF